jgi:hypothetical protein
MTFHQKARPAISLQDAAAASVTLGKLSEMVALSRQYLMEVQTLIPPAIRPQIEAGPVEAGSWCMLVRNASAASKLRHLAPDIQHRLASRGHLVDNIRIKILHP